MVGGLAEQLRSDASADDRVYVFTPEGHVVDLMAGATPVDFAYYVHTQVGNHCSGARVNDRIVALNYQLKTGDRVEILSSELNEPNREWLKPHLGYVNSPRARAKLVQWFKTQDREQNIRYGKQWLETELNRLAIRQLPYEEVSRRLGCRNAEGLFVSIGTGAIEVHEVIDTAQQLSLLSSKPDLFTDEQSETGMPANSPVIVNVLVIARDRAGLLRDVTTILANEAVYVLAVNTRSDKRSETASIQLEIEISSYHSLARALDRLNHLDSVIEARRLEDGEL